MMRNGGHAIDYVMNHRLGRLAGLFVLAAALQFSISRAQDNNAAPAAPADNGATDATPTGPTADVPTGPITNASATFQTFYDGLAGEGTWIQTQQYGYVWQPQVTDPNWAPYTDGYWAYSDQGWTWVSNEAWGWATYHYGRWANLDGVGWVWVPGYQWAPAVGELAHRQRQCGMGRRCRRTAWWGSITRARKTPRQPMRAPT